MNVQRLKDRLAFPLLTVISPDRARRWGLTPLEDERLVICAEQTSGRLLDIGCGPNELVQRYGRERGIGVDVFPWRGLDALCDTTKLPFRDQSFDTVSLVACLNHIPQSQRAGVLAEARRVLRDDGQLLVTMIDRVIGRIAHRVREETDFDQQERGIHHDEDLGLWDSEVRELLEAAGFSVEWRRRFVFGLNNFYRSTKAL